MSLPQLKQHGYTLEDWKQWEGRWELLHGVAYSLPPWNLDLPAPSSSPSTIWSWPGRRTRKVSA